MAGLDYHSTLTSPTEYELGDSGISLMNKMNDNEAQLLANAQLVENRLEDVQYEMFGSGVLEGLVPSIGTGLAVDVTAGTALIGRLVTGYSGGSIAVVANANPGYIYHCQDGTWEVNATGTPPSAKAYYEFAQYVSDATSVLSVTTPPKVLPCKVVTISSTFENIHIPAMHYRDYWIDHSASVVYQVPGFIVVSVSPSPAFTVEHISGEQDTGEGFYVRITRAEAYQSYSQYYYKSGDDYGPYAQCSLSFTRTGLAYN